ncbi:MAG TPA: 6-phosphogluconolactonase [Phycisphaerae bacterium]|nr:6-phosphogluconolactonase [Phycisphaerae bacterium]
MDKARTIFIEDSQQAAACRAVEVIESVVHESVASRDVCNIALAGGTTPIPAYQVLATRAMTGSIPWNRVNFFFGDERNVPPDHIESNYHTAQRELFDKAPVDWSRVYPMPGDAADLQAAAVSYEQTIRHVVGDNSGAGIPHFDLIMLGMGCDGHVASLFAGSALLDETKKLVAAEHVEMLGRYRMTMTLPLIKAAHNVLLLVTGEDKAEMVYKAVIEGDRSIPAMHIKPTSGKFWIVVDKAAARLAVDEIEQRH